MSSAITIAEAIVEKINAITTLVGVQAVVWRQKDLESELAKRSNQSKGAVVVCLYAGFTNESGNGFQLAVRRRYVLSIYAKPSIRHATQTPADEIAETVARTLHNWDPIEADDAMGEIQVTACDLRPDDQWLIYDLDVEAVSRL